MPLPSSAVHAAGSKAVLIAPLRRGCAMVRATLKATTKKRYRR